MAVAPIIPALLSIVIAGCKCDYNSQYSSGIGHSDSKFAGLLKPPPPPSLSQILPVPFYSGRIQRQHIDVSYHPPPPSPPPSLPTSAEFQFPAQFYEQYNFNFLRSPQPFTSTPPPTFYQKVSTWLFPSEQTSHDVGSKTFNNNNISPVKKDCNPCNLVPWIPVIRYNNLGAKNTYQNSLPTYGPPSPTAFAQNIVSKDPQTYSVQNDHKNIPQLRPGIPQVTYNTPVQSYRLNSNNQVIATYGPPSPTHTIETNPPYLFSTIPSSSYEVPILSSNSQGTLEKQPSSFYFPANSQKGLSSVHTVTSSYTPSTFLYTTPQSTESPSSVYGTPGINNSFRPVTPPVVPGVISKEVPKNNDVEILNNNLEEQHLPEVTYQTKFRNSYGDPVPSKDALNAPYSMSAVAAESTKIQTQVLPEGTVKRFNTSLALANPAPFTLNKGRNIHTLQPVALPNLSVSPLPPIFNARPFRPVASYYPATVTQGVDQRPVKTNHVNIEQSVPLVEITHSVDYPATFIESPIIDIDASKSANQSKEYRHISNSYTIDEIKDITSLPSEDHVSATKSVSDSSFESTGSDAINDLSDIRTHSPANLKQSSNVHTNFQGAFSDLRGVKDVDVDKYRFESHLQNIDSPLLYLKPSIPHKKHENFVENVSPVVFNEYEIYDERPVTTETPSSPILNWEDNQTGFVKHVDFLKKDEYRPNIVQIIVPYTTGNKNQDSIKDFTQVSSGWTDTTQQEFQARKIPFSTENSSISLESYSTPSGITTEQSTSVVTEKYDPDQHSSEFNDSYDVRDPPFDIVKLQHTIDDWTEQEYSKDYKTLQKTRQNENYAKKIPDEYFTTTVATDYGTETTNYNYDLFDHESASSIQSIQSVAKDNSQNVTRPRKEYNAIERTKIKSSIDKAKTDKYNTSNDLHKFFIYTAASSFRTSSSTTSTSTTTTTTATSPAPWGKIQTSISPLTKEKVYVVTSKPWRDIRNQTNRWYDELNSMRNVPKKDMITSDGLPFQSPRFINRPSFGFTSGGKVESGKSDFLFGMSRSWFQTINDLENQGHNSTLYPIESLQQGSDTYQLKDNT